MVAVLDLVLVAHDLLIAVFRISRRQMGRPSRSFFRLPAAIAFSIIECATFTDPLCARI
jgi:hypothetical protein